MAWLICAIALLPFLQQALFAQDPWRALPSGTSADLYDISFRDSLLGMAVGASAVVLRTTDAGESWKSQELRGIDTTDKSFSRVFLFGRDVGYLVGESARGAYLWRTTDDGGTWSLLLTVNSDSIDRRSGLPAVSATSPQLHPGDSS